MNDRLNNARRELENGKGIFVIQTAFLGDVVLVTPLLKAIKHLFPKSPLTALVLPPWKEVVGGWCDNVVTIDKRHADRAGWNELVRTIKSGDYGAAFIPHRSFRSGWLAWSAGIPVRIGFSRGSGRHFHTDKVPYKYGIYEGERNLSLLSPFHQGEFNSLPDIPTTSQCDEAIRQKIAEIGNSSPSFVVFAPASVWKTKEWCAEQYQTLAKYFSSEYGIISVAVGGKEDVHRCSQAILDEKYNLTGKLSPLESVALMRHSRFVISGDSAAAHLATAAGSRQVIIFGSTSPRFGFLPPTLHARAIGLDMYCRPCTDHGRQKCPISRSALCLDSIQPQMVIDAVSDWLELNEETAVFSVDKG